MSSLFARLPISPLDLRLGLMAGVLCTMALVFHALTGQFLTPENLYNIAQQTAVRSWPRWSGPVWSMISEQRFD